MRIDHLDRMFIPAQCFLEIGEYPGLVLRKHHDPPSLAVQRVVDRQVNALISINADDSALAFH
ncbi:hypothetical protein OS035_05840 [Rhizobium sp. 268]|uniref:hypothetical protein n=1 Tax=Rhizobium sp. 268 TaxID=2996375 RepID=UPI002F944BF2